MTEIRKLLDTLACDAEIWLAGKGPSLNDFDWTKAGRCRIGINEAAFKIPKCWGAIAVDYDRLNEYVSALRRDVTVMLPSGYWQYAYPLEYRWEEDKYVNLQYTIAIALNVLADNGAEVFHLIGCDSFDNVPGYADPNWAEPKYKGNDPSYPKQDDYDEANALVLKIAKERNLKLIWEHRNV